MEAKTRTSTYKTTVTVNGQEVEVEVPTEQTYYVAVPEEITKDISPPLKDYVRLVIVGLAVVFGFRFMWIILSAYDRDLKAGGRPTITTKATEAKMDKSMSFVFGLILGFVGAGSQEPIIVRSESTTIISAEDESGEQSDLTAIPAPQKSPTK
jgi:hypothetical protein